ncbi:MAG: tetratricopeptide repeat protein [Dialister sp.]|uniref:tetratricopeptide repeat protein n=1 Tax=Dialister sp. TaxID=1955814 RepID=UPI002E79BD1D|nr:tetratricopeptide repeat protein [Dialister sp.]MEE0292106.1 tetratricopeptide repeat protein [Dialister sp.]
MKRKMISMLAACLLSAAAIAPAFAEGGAAPSAKPAGVQEVLERLYTHISEDAKAEAPSLKPAAVRLTPEQGKKLLSAMAERAAKEHPDRFEAYVFRGTMYYTNGEKEKCFADLDHAVTLAPENPLAYGSRAEFSARDGRDKEALQDWDKALSLNPTDEVKDKVYMQRGLFHMSRKQYEAAASDFKNDLKYVNPKLRFGVQIFTGDCYAKLGKNGEAEKSYREAVKDNPKNPLCWDMLGHFYNFTMKQHDKAKECYDKALALAPKSDMILREAGVNEMGAKRMDRAVTYFTRAIEANPTHRLSYMLRGSCYSKLGLYDKAIQDYTKASGLEPENYRPYESLGYNYSLKKDYDKAIPWYEKAIALNPKSGEAYNNLGYTWFLKGNKDKALEYLNKAIEVSPAYAESYRSRAEVYESIGEFDKALADMDHFVTLSPKDAKGREFRNRLAEKARHA